MSEKAFIEKNGQTQLAIAKLFLKSYLIPTNVPLGEQTAATNVQNIMLNHRPENKLTAIIWCADEIKSILARHFSYIHYNNNDISKIVNTIRNQHDPESGVNYDVISTHIYLHFQTQIQAQTESVIKRQAEKVC